MNTEVNKTNFDFSSSSNTSSTTSKINTENTNNQNTSTTSDYSSTTPVESVDLSFATEEVATESKSIFTSVGEFFNGIGEGIKNTGATIINGAKAVANWAIDGLKELGSNIKEACGNLASNVKTILGSTLTWVADTYLNIQSTAAVIGTSIVSGIADIVEGIVDGLAWTGGKIVEGGSWLIGKIAGWFNDDAEESIMNWRAQAKKDVKEFIATDWIGEANDWFYQKTALGKFINENSYFKYDSEAMQKLRGASEMVGKLVLATAATIVTGGSAAPIALGFLFGTGTQAEKVYKENPNATGAQELGIFVSGLGEAANWYAQGKLGEGGLNFLNLLKSNGIKQTGAVAINGVKTVLSNIKTNGFGTTIKEVVKNFNWKSLMATDNLADSAGIVADNASNWLVGNEEFNLGNVLKAGGELIAAWGLNMFFDGASDYIGKMDNPRIETTNISTDPIDSIQNPQASVKNIEPESLEINQQVSNEIQQVDIETTQTPELSTTHTIEEPTNIGANPESPKIDSDPTQTPDLVEAKKIEAPVEDSISDTTKVDVDITKQPVEVSNKLLSEEYDARLKTYENETLDETIARVKENAAAHGLETDSATLEECVDEYIETIKSKIEKDLKKPLVDMEYKDIMAHNPNLDPEAAWKEATDRVDTMLATQPGKRIIYDSDVEDILQRQLTITDMHMEACLDGRATNGIISYSTADEFYFDLASGSYYFQSEAYNAARMASFMEGASSPNAVRVSETYLNGTDRFLANYSGKPISSLISSEEFSNAPAGTMFKLDSPPQMGNPKPGQYQFMASASQVDEIMTDISNITTDPMQMVIKRAEVLGLSTPNSSTYIEVVHDLEIKEGILLDPHSNYDQANSQFLTAGLPYKIIGEKPVSAFELVTPSYNAKDIDINSSNYQIKLHDGTSIKGGRVIVDENGGYYLVKEDY